MPLLWSGANHSLMGVVNPVLNHYIDWPLVRGLAIGVRHCDVDRDSALGKNSNRPARPRRRRRWAIDSARLARLSAGDLCILLSGCSDDFPGKPRQSDAFVMPQNITDFKQLYATRCAGCHGADGTFGPGPPLNDPIFVALVTRRRTARRDRRRPPRHADAGMARSFRWPADRRSKSTSW